MIDLPVPYIYVADVKDGEDEGRIEIVDGSQRTRTLVRFLKNEFQLQDLELLSKLNGFRFSDLSKSRQLRFKRKTIRFIELMAADEEARRQIFYRINSGGTTLKPMEKRFGTEDGEFLELVKTISQNERFREMCPISSGRKKFKEYEEMVLRFFAYHFDKESYKKEVTTFLNDFMKKMNWRSIDVDSVRPNVIFDEDLFNDTFTNMLDFIEMNMKPLYFKKSMNNTSVPRIRFEAISLGVAQALQAGSPIDTINIKNWINSDILRILTESDASNSLPKFNDRTNFVSCNLLSRPWVITSSTFEKKITQKDFVASGIQFEVLQDD
jgi:hypothetical protein